MQTKIYIDEAGNTGSDIMGEQQPVFVLAGVMINSEQEKDIFKLLDEQFNANKEKEELEIKGNKWSKSPKKAHALQMIIDEILSQGGVISVVIIEKRYMAGAMVIDNFFDYVYNDIEDQRWVNDKTVKMKGANYYFERMSDELATKVWNLFQVKREIPEYEQAIDELINITDIDEYKALLQGAKPHLPKMVKDLFDKDLPNDFLGDIPTRTMRAPNFSAFNTLTNMLIPICQYDEVQAALIVDEQKQFEKSYHNLYRIFSNIDIPYIRIGKEPNDCIYSWKGFITGLSVANSKTEPGIQLADIVASSICNLMAKTQTNESVSYLELDRFNMCLLHTLDKSLHSVHYVVSAPFYQKYLEAVIAQGESNE